MALFNEILTGRYNGIIHKLLNMKEGAPAPTLSSDIQASITVDSEQPDWAFLGGVWRGSQYVEKALDVGNISYVGLFNGQLTGMLAIVRRVILYNQTAAATRGRVMLGNSTGLTTTSPGIAHDCRWKDKRSACLVGSGIEAALTGFTLFQWALPPGSMLELALDVVLSPNSVGQIPIPNVCVEGIGVNQAVQATFVWEERPLESSETR